MENNGVVTGDGFIFDIDGTTDIRWYDPPLVSTYEFEILGGSALFASIILPCEISKSNNLPRARAVLS